MMIGDSGISLFVDKIFGGIASGIGFILNFILKVLLANHVVALLIIFILINFLAILLMKKDKEYAGIPGAKRIRERTLLITAYVGGAFGEYYAMYKFKHKTLHKKFLYGVPLAMVFQFALLSYNIFLWIFA